MPHSLRIDDLVLDAISDKAFLVRLMDVEPDEAEINESKWWIPLSQLEETDLKEVGDDGYIEIPTWLAEEKGLDEHGV